MKFGKFFVPNSQRLSKNSNFPWWHLKSLKQQFRTNIWNYILLLSYMSEPSHTIILNMKMRNSIEFLLVFAPLNVEWTYVQYTHANEMKSETFAGWLIAEREWERKSDIHWVWDHEQHHREYMRNPCPWARFFWLHESFDLYFLLWNFEKTRSKSQAKAIQRFNMIRYLFRLTLSGKVFSLIDNIFQRSKFEHNQISLSLSHSKVASILSITICNVSVSYILRLENTGYQAIASISIISVESKHIFQSFKTDSSVSGRFCFWAKVTHSQFYPGNQLITLGNMFAPTQ